MTKCATEQGYGKAANYLGIDLSTDKRYSEALAAFQKGVQAGNPQSASFLKNAFDTDPSDALYYLGSPRDAERSRRYKVIWEFLTNNDGLNPKVPDIDQIVPLPPAKLPPWDGTFQWQTEQEAAKPPQKPDEKLVERLVREKNLDPATGLPLAPAKSTKAERVPLGTTLTRSASFSRFARRVRLSSVLCSTVAANFEAISRAVPGSVPDRSATCLLRCWRLPSEVRGLARR
jgi:hypothetical protein